MPSDPILDAFGHRARRRPEAPLAVQEERVATVGDVAALAAALSVRLAPKAQGQASRASRASLEPGSLVALEAANGPAFLAGLLALRRLRLPAILLDPRSGSADGERTARALGAAAILDCQRGFPGCAEDFSLRQLLPAAEATRLPEEVAVVKLTSGSTGLPRGVLAPSETLVADDRALASSMGLQADERILAAIPMSHSYGLSSVALPALMRGSLLVVPSGRLPLAAMAAARTGRVTFLPTVPAYLQALVKREPPPPWPESLRLVITAGAPLSPATAERFHALYGHPVQVFYGTSETGGITFDRVGGAAERGTLGTPVDGVRIELEPLLPSEAASEGTSQEGAPGTVTVASAAVARGYLPACDQRLHKGRFRTQDLGAFDNGELRLLGRADDLVNIKGKKVNPREIEAVLSQASGVDEVAVLGLPTPGGEVLRAVVAGSGLTVQHLQATCRRHLPDHKIPRSILLVPELPRTPRGKLDRQALRSL